jgi:hypothetical protein
VRNNQILGVEAIQEACYLPLPKVQTELKIVTFREIKNAMDEARIK